MGNVTEIRVKTPEEIELEDANIVRRRYNSLVEATLFLQEKNKKLEEHVEYQQELLENAQRNVDINKKIAMDSILMQNSIKDEFSNEINILKDKLKKAQAALEA